MDKKEQARQQIVRIMRDTQERMRDFVARMEGHFDDYLSENKFSRSSSVKQALTEMEEFMERTEEAIRNPSDANIERFIAESARFADYCGEKARES